MIVSLLGVETCAKDVQNNIQTSSNPQGAPGEAKKNLGNGLNEENRSEG